MTFRVASHPRLRRDGTQLFSQIELSYLDAILGSSPRVETLRGSKVVQVPPGVQPGDVITLPFDGVDRLGGKSTERGPHHVTLSVRLPRPEELSHSEVQVLQVLKEIGGGSTFSSFLGQEPN